MPSLGADMEAGTLRSWRIAVGDRVKKGQVVGEVETDKGIIELEIWDEGIVDAILVEPGTKVPVGTALARIASGAAAVPATPPAAPPAPAAPSPPPAAPSPPSRAAARATDLRASPAARLRARELGVDLATATATGPHGSITRDDVDRAAARPAPTPVAAPTAAKAELAPAADRHAAMRRAIAAAMARSKREIPHYYLATTIDATAAQRWLADHNATRPPAERILLAALLIRATGRALKAVPELNGFYYDDAFHPSEHVHVGFAISLRGGGLVAPAIHDVETKSVAQIMTDLRDLVARARTGAIRSSELVDPTITITNLGEQGVETLFGVIYPPQVAIVGFGKVVERPFARDGMVGAHPVLQATLAADHRVSDGHRGGLFLATLAKHIEEPEP